MLSHRFYRALQVVALTVLVSGGCLTFSMPAQAQLVPKLPIDPPGATETPAVGTPMVPPAASPPQPTAAPPAAKAPSPGVSPSNGAPPQAKKPGGHNIKVPSTPPATYVERRMHQVHDFIDHAGSELAPILPGILIGVRMAAMLLVMIGYVAFHFQRQRRTALEAEQQNRLSEAEIEFGKDADRRHPGSQENSP